MVKTPRARIEALERQKKKALAANERKYAALERKKKALRKEEDRINIRFQRRATKIADTKR